MDQNGAGHAWAQNIRFQDAEDNRNQDAQQASLLELCVANGIKEEDLQHPEKITHIEMVLDDYCCMGSLRYFPGLKSVCLIQQAIERIEGLENCLNLERLHLSENRIRRIEGLHQCRSLKALYVNSNQITEIGPGLMGLRELETLWVSENQLSHLEGLGNAPNLTELNAARNRLSSVARSFDSNPRLTSINLSDNRICSFRGILDLARLPDLQELAFSDPDWGENPICALCNYQTYILYHLPTLRIFDRMHLGEEAHRLAEATYLKKRLYYNMRIKFIKRQATDSLRAAKAIREETSASVTQDLEAVMRGAKQIDAYLQTRNPGDDADALCHKRAVLESQLHDRLEELEDVSVQWNFLNQEIHDTKEAVIRRLLLELQTGGNVRFEHGSPERDSWCQSVVELVRSRFLPEDYAQLGIVDIRVLQVTRIHNRFLRSRFEDFLERADGQKHVDYLFYGANPRDLQSFQRAQEEGFLPEGADRDEGETILENPVPLSNSVSVVDVSRLQQHLHSEAGQAAVRAVSRWAKQGGSVAGQAWPGSGDSGLVQKGMVPLRSGELLVCSAYLGSQKPDQPATFDGTLGPFELWQKEPSRHTNSIGGSNGIGNQGLNASEDGSSAVPVVAPALCRARLDDPKQKLWWVFRPDLVLPEYLVEFDYVYASDGASKPGEEDRNGHGPFAGLLRDFSLFARLGSAAPAAAAAAALPPRLPEPTPLERLSPEELVDVQYAVVPTPMVAHLADLKILDLHGRRLRRIDPQALSHLTSLETLLLSFNCVESLSCIPGVPTVVTLDVSFNLVQKISALTGFPALQKLDLSWNSLLFAEDVGALARDLPKLEDLSLAGNPLAEGNSHRKAVLLRLPGLRLLDGKEVPEDEKGAAKSGDLQTGGVTEAMVLWASYASPQCHNGVRSSSGTTGGLPLGLQWASEGGRIAHLLGAAPGQDLSSVSPDTLAEPLKGHVNGLTHENWRGYVESIDLHRKGLQELPDLSNFPAIRRMLLCQNQLMSMNGMTPCVTLEELSVEENALTSLQGIPQLPNLRRLDAGSNKITDVPELHGLGKLCQLSLEDNYIDSLDAFSSLEGLIELYLSNNLIEDLRSVLVLRNLPKLIILDLSGNALCSAPEYRLYTIFHLKKLKVLDGVSVTQAEQNEARERFSGRLTVEMLEERLGPSVACYNFRSVDLSNCKLRDLGVLLNDDTFPSLRELTLDGNPFDSMQSVGPLSKLLVLRVNRTRIDLEHGMLGEDDASGLRAMPHLQVLEIGGCGVTDLSPFAHFPLLSLRILHLPGNEIQRIEGLSHLEQLRELVLDRNRIKQCDERSFRGLRCLRELHLEDNGLRSLSHFGPLPRLRTLYLSLNRIADVAELEKLGELRNAVQIHMSQNPVARKPLYRAQLIRMLPSLRIIDNKEVTEEEREKVEQMVPVTDPSKPMGQPVYVLMEQHTPQQAVLVPSSSSNPGTSAKVPNPITVKLASDPSAQGGQGGRRSTGDPGAGSSGSSRPMPPVQQQITPSIVMMGQARGNFRPGRAL